MFAYTEEMKDMNKLVLVVLITVLVMAVPGFATPITIVNPGFDDDPLGKGTSQPLWNIGFVGPNPARTCTDDCISDWTLTSGTVDWVSNSVWQPHNGSWSIDLNGNNTGVLSIDLGVQAAGTYDLTFWMSKNYMKTTQAELAVKVTGMDTPWVFSYNSANTAADMMWALKSQTFSWGGGTMQITFQSLQTLLDEISMGPTIDDISLSRRDEGVPEPGTVWTLLTGVGLLAGALTLRKKI